MELQEAFAIFSDEEKMKRPHMIMSHSIKWLKQLVAWGNEESTQMGYIIPQSMIDDANANDWEIYKDEP